MAHAGKKATATQSEHKHRAIQRAGTDVFLRLGYGSASMDLIAAEAGVSKQTVYNHFQSKEALFKAIVEDLTSTLMAPLVVRDAARSTPERVLRSLGRDFLALMLRPSSLALYRLIVAESARFPELGGSIYAVGAGRLLAMLADYLAWETRNGRLSVSEPELAAEQLVGMLTGRIQLRALLGCAAPDEAELQRRTDHAISSFLALYAPRRLQAMAARPRGYPVTKRTRALARAADGGRGSSAASQKARHRSAGRLQLALSAGQPSHILLHVVRSIFDGITGCFRVFAEALDSVAPCEGKSNNRQKERDRCEIPEHTDFSSVPVS